MVFTGRAVYDNFTSIAEDVSDIIGMISPSETPLLDVLGDADRPARNVLHEWLEDELNPNTIVSSTTVNDSAQSAAFHYKGSPVSRNLMVGTILKSNTSGE